MKNVLSTSTSMTPTEAKPSYAMYSSSLMSPFLPLLSITNNPLFPPGLDQPQAFAWWTFRCVTQVRHLLNTQAPPTSHAPQSEFFPFSSASTLAPSPTRFSAF